MDQEKDIQYIIDIESTEDKEQESGKYADSSDCETAAAQAQGTSVSEKSIGSDKRIRNQKRKKKRPPIWVGMIIGAAAMLIVCIASLIFIGVRIVGEDDGESAYIKKVETIKEYINKNFLWDVDEDALEEGIADGLVSALGDKYAAYYTPEEFKSMQESVSGIYAGIGVSVFWNDDSYAEVYKVFDDTPAKEAGILVGDLIVEAGGIDSFESLDELVSAVKGEVGTSVDLVIERDGERISMTVERASISMETVTYRMIDERIGYIYIAEFDTVTTEQFNTAIDELTEQGMEAVILDLRDNPGGDYDTVVAMADRVLPEGVIMTVKDKNGTIKTENSDAAHSLEIPMAVLINGNSASASEVFVGAIQDYGMATIIGERSFGKGIVQSIYQLYDGSGLKFTTRQYYTPSGDSIHGVGITPDIEVSLPEDAYDDGTLDEDEDTQLQKAIEVLSK